MAQFTLSAGVAASAMRMVQNTLRGYPPPLQARSSVQPLAGLGMYLHAYGYLSRNQLIDALRHQSARRRSWNQAPFGELLIERGFAKPQVVASMLVFQSVNRLVHQHQPRFFGEHLLAVGHITPAQLEEALQAQFALRADGYEAPLGELLLQHHMMRRAHRDAALIAFLQSEATPHLLEHF